MSNLQSSAAGPTNKSALKYRRPNAGPSPADVADRDRWDELVKQSLESTRSAAEKWRTGLAAFVALITGGLVIKGPETASDLTWGWHVVLTILGGAGLLATVLGLWLALYAAAGSPAKLSYPEIVSAYGGVVQFEVAAARKAADVLRVARVVVGAALLILLATLLIWWWAPSKPSSPPAFVSVEVGSDTVCGTLESADNNEMRLKVEGESSARIIPFDTIGNFMVTTSC